MSDLWINGELVKRNISQPATIEFRDSEPGKVEFSYLDAILTYLDALDDSSRATGRSTKARCEVGAEDILVVATQHEKTPYLETKSISASSVAILEEKLRGRRFRNLIIDHYAEYIMVRNLLREAKSRIQSMVRVESV